MLKIGDPISCEVIHGNKEKVITPIDGQHQEGYEYYLVFRYRDYADIGYTFDGWVQNIDYKQKEIRVDDTSFGWFGLKSKYLERYLNASKYFIKVIKERHNFSKLDKEQLVNIKDVFYRIVKKNRPDFAILYVFLNQPDFDQIKYSMRFLDRVLASKRKSSTSKIYDDLTFLKKSNFINNLEHLIENLNNHNPNLYYSNFVKGSDFVLPPLVEKREYSKNLIEEDPIKKIISLPEEKKVPKVRQAYKLTELDNAHRIDTQNLSKINDKKIIFPTNKILKRKIKHEEIVKGLNDYLKSRGIRSFESKNIDLFCMLKSGSAIFEIKTISNKRYTKQLRSAIAQLYEYRFFNDLAKASLWIVFSSPINDEKTIDYILNDRQINLLWLEEEELSGPSINKLKEEIVGND